MMISGDWGYINNIMILNDYLIAREINEVLIVLSLNKMIDAACGQLKVNIHIMQMAFQKFKLF